MLKSFLRLISTLDTMQYDDWRERMKERSKIKLKIAGVLFAFVAVMLVFLRIIT